MCTSNQQALVSRIAYIKASTVCILCTQNLTLGNKHYVPSDLTWFKGEYYVVMAGFSPSSSTRVLHGLLVTFMVALIVAMPANGDKGT